MTKHALTPPRLKTMKQQGTKIAMMTAYDYPAAQLSEEAGVDLILVGDSLGNVVLGYDTTVPVTLNDMIYHTKSVVRGAPNTMIVTDMPFATYRLTPQDTLLNAARIMQEGGAHAVKMEGGAELAEEVLRLTSAGIPVLGHLGLTPQSVLQIGGYKIQGKVEKEIERLLSDAKALEEAGAFGIVLELVTEPIAEAVTRSVNIPTIGIGAGRGCDGQVIVYHDLIRYGSNIRDKRFVKTYANVGDTIRTAIGEYVQDVKNQAFPEEKHAFPLDEEASRFISEKLYGGGAK
ncbi:3-methyl-2-oxobutanoate hydroxymethyltransferase [Cohnella thailandensis]|jgi:3-methyl-2-oxobutanoate hydroxymethyltransferase|uniref:3-methyl-2-oxobutanoate hydroxymethyltransferase n=1 Tax=Cohnella thailandensis TaxID=557557 RepID=A0A841T2N4_9BACL|nr:3-methyl-2-oxobutanoate hydroxymethyltransferase [Cohnella thailandensis]MBB6635351.1 3-methyl-2-oxobutanoate hydroxymethyltransferase [Cohnella thailandensis]MBP1974730.1 3-methyl-2-oxobutanoate hydroxymethyltransferase [Cohnella thailandensis]